MTTETRSKISTWLESVGAEIGTQLTLDQDGHCLILFGAQLECMVEVPDESEIFFAYIALKRAPDDLAERSDLFERALELNLFSLATGGSSVAFDRRTQEVVLTFSAEAATMDDALFKVVLSDFLELGMDLHEKLNEASPFAGPPEQDEKSAAFILKA